MHGNDRRDHHADGGGGAQRREQTQDEEQSATELGQARQGGVAASGPEAHRLEELPRALEAVAPEGSEELLGAVGGQHRAHHRPHHQDAEVHGNVLPSQ